MKKIILFFVLLLIVSQTFAQTNNYSIKGVVKTENGFAGFATLGIESINAYTITDENGRFELRHIPAGRHKILVRRMGLVTKTVDVEISGGDISIEIQMQTATFKVEQVEIMARRHKADKLEIGETAIEYLQPVSLGDLAVLLPGNVYTENPMTQFSLNSSRQVGADKNSSLGIAVTSDGVPQTSDGVRIQMVGITENSYSGSGDSQIKARTGINSGTDMRYISTDHIQSVEVNRGISSPKYGNLSAGQILVNSKYGVSPLRIRTKIDLKNKLFYAGKGFSLGPKAGNLHIGADYLYSYDDIREEMEKFTRITAQAYYNNQIKFGDGRSIDIDFKAAQTISVNKMKKDELTYEYNETYKADYNKTDLMLKAKVNLNSAWVEQVGITTSLARTSDRIDRHYCVITANPKSMPLSYSEGESEGFYLPTMYYSDFYIENIPINFYAQLNVKSRLDIAQKISLSLE
ncbi:MAG: TonB-dependent receptor, partial [Bacteroidales bacterium]|nr:TonB-dependent receptor [Bacteroidales bacterium]